MILHHSLYLYWLRRLGSTFVLSATFLGVAALPNTVQTARAQTSPTPSQDNPLYINCKVQEYDATTQVATCRTDVELLFPARGIQATAAQAQYFFRERRIILSGNVYILQEGRNSIQAEIVTYLIDEGRFIATPKAGRQVQSIYVVKDSTINPPSATPAPTIAPFQRSN